LSHWGTRSVPSSEEPLQRKFHGEWVQTSESIIASTNFVLVVFLDNTAHIGYCDISCSLCSPIEICHRKYQTQTFAHRLLGDSFNAWWLHSHPTASHLGALFDRESSCRITYTELAGWRYFFMDIWKCPRYTVRGCRDPDSLHRLGDERRKTAYRTQ